MKRDMENQHLCICKEISVCFQFDMVGDSTLDLMCFPIIDDMNRVS
jgi:hypothetical protein